ncbi:MAG: hypothetical protein AAF628_29460 [Planctomycetota bacterium]
MRWCPVLFAAAICASAAAQQVFVVSGGGRALQLAAQRANPGDTLVVRPARYSPVIVDKGIAVLCDPGVTIYSSAPLEGLRISGVPAGEVFAMRGGVFEIGTGAFPLAALDCAGALVFEQVDVPAGFVRDCAQVAFNDVETTDLTVTRSSVSFVDCVMAGGFGDPTSGSVLLGLNASIAVSGGSVIGADAQSPRPAMRAIYAIDSRLTVAGSAATTLAGGNGGVPALELVGGSLRIDPAVSLVAYGSPAIVGTGTVTQTAIPWVQAQGVASGQPFTEVAHGTPGALLAVFANVPVAPITTPFGDLWLTLPGLVIDAGVVPPGRTLTRSFALPPLPRGATFVFQPIELMPPGPLVIGTPTGVVAH